MLIFEAQNYFKSRRAKSVVCLKHGTTFFINYYQAHDWQTIFETDKEWLVTSEGAYVAEFNEGILADIMEQDLDPIAMAAEDKSINGGFVQGSFLNLTQNDGNCVSIDKGAAIMESPHITTIQDSVNTVIADNYTQQEHIQKLEKMVKDLQPKPKRLIFAEQKLYKLK